MVPSGLGLIKFLSSRKMWVADELVSAGQLPGAGPEIKFWVN